MAEPEFKSGLRPLKLAFNHQTKNILEQCIPKSVPQNTHFVQISRKKEKKEKKVYVIKYIWELLQTTTPSCRLIMYAILKVVRIFPEKKPI